MQWTLDVMIFQRPIRYGEWMCRAMCRRKRATLVLELGEEVLDIKVGVGRKRDTITCA